MTHDWMEVSSSSSSMFISSTIIQALQCITTNNYAGGHQRSQWLIVLVAVILVINVVLQPIRDLYDINSNWDFTAVASVFRCNMPRCIPQPEWPGCRGEGCCWELSLWNSRDQVASLLDPDSPIHIFYHACVPGLLVLLSHKITRLHYSLCNHPRLCLEWLISHVIPVTYMHL